jgi:hypothetical protein
MVGAIPSGISRLRAGSMMGGGGKRVGVLVGCSVGDAVENIVAVADGRNDSVARLVGVVDRGVTGMGVSAGRSFDNAG